MTVPPPSLTGHGNFSCTDHYVGAQLTFVDYIFAHSLAISGNFRMDTKVGVDNISVSGALFLGGGVNASTISAGGDISLLLGPTPHLSQARKDALSAIANSLNDLAGRPTTYAGGLLTYLGWSRAGGAIPLLAKYSTKIGDIGAVLTTINVWSQAQQDALATLSSDPPDQNFRSVPVPIRVQLPTVASGSGISASAAARLNTLIAACSRADSLAQPLLTAVNRAGGATDAGAANWEKVQLQAAGRFASQLAPLDLTCMSDLRTATSTLANAHDTKAVISSANVEALISWVKAHGLPAGITSVLRGAGDGAPIQSALATEIAGLPDQPITIAYPSVSPAFVSEIKNEVAILKAFAARMRTNPLAPVQP